MVNKLGATCRHGHPNIPENRRPTKVGTVCRLCAAIARARQREQYKKPSKDD